VTLIRKLWHMILLAVAVLAWLGFARHPTTRQFRRAVVASIGLA